MEEEGTEIVLQPGTDTNLLQFCTTEPVEETKSNQEILPSPCGHSGEGVEKAPTPTLSSHSIEESIEKEQRQESSTNRAFFPEPVEHQQPFQPEVNRYDSLMESGTTDEDDKSVLSAGNENSETNDENYHPALKAAVFNEGQEAVWHEDEYSTISSVYYVKPEKDTTEVLPSRSRKKIKVPFFKSRGKKAQKIEPVPEEVESAPRPVKIHIKKKKVAKAVVLLPPKEAEAEEMKDPNDDREIVDCELMKENEKYASITQNSIQARRLLDTALSGEGLDEEESERLTKEAFNHATVARRLASDIPDDDDDYDEEAIELENIMSQLAEEGEQAALQHRRQYSIDEDSDNEEDSKNNDVEEGARYSNAIDLTMMEAEVPVPSKDKVRGKFPVSEYAARAVHYLESILPKNIGNEEGDSDDAKRDDISISTLGLKNDTQEYELDNDEGDDEPDETPDHVGAALPRLADMLSLSSLNEILDGAGTVKSQLEKYAVVNEEIMSRNQPSPRAAVQEIGIPKKRNPELPPIPPRKNRTGILGLLTPKKTPKSTKQSNKNEKNDGADEISNKKWGIFFNKTPRANEGVPSQLSLVLGDQEEGKNEEVSSAAEKMVEGDSDSYLDMPEDTRYDPAFDDEESESGSPDKYRTTPQNDAIDEKLSVAMDEDKYSKNTGGGDDKVSDDTQSPSLKEEFCESIIQNEKPRIDLSPTNDDNSEDGGNRDRYQTEPVGMTPRRDGVELEENTNKRFDVDGTESMEEDTVLTVTKAEPGDKKSESIPQQTNVNENLESQMTSINEGPVSDTEKVSKPASETPIEDETKPSIVGKRDEVVGQSEGSKSKILDRVVGKVEKTKRKPLVPNSVVEEKYLVNKAMKKISTGEEQNNPTKTKKVLPTAAQRAISQMKKNATSSSFTVIDDSTTVVQKAISNGNLKANESNEEGDDVVPLNYLSAMLKQKLYVENVKGHYGVTSTGNGELGDKQDADSYVAAIRGPRPKEAPGVALEEVAIRKCKNNRDPSTGSDINSVVVDLAPTPRRPTTKPYMFDDEGKEAEDRARDIAMKEQEEERRRRRLITERLFKAGSSSFNDDATIKKASEDAIKMAPTVASAESYGEEPVQENAIDESDSNKKIIQKIDSHSRTKPGRGRRKLTISFLKGSKRK